MRLVIVLVAMGLVALADLPAAFAATYKIVAFGASNTNGKGVDREQAFPAQIQRMLRAKGIDAQVSVIAVNGRNSSQLLRSVDSIPSGTDLVLIESVLGNDKKDGIASSNAANLAQLQSTLRAKGVNSIVINLRPLPADGLQVDGVHLTPSGHQAIAAHYVPEIMGAFSSR